MTFLGEAVANFQHHGHLHNSSYRLFACSNCMPDIFNVRHTPCHNSYGADILTFKILSERLAFGRCLAKS